MLSPLLTHPMTPWSGVRLGREDKRLLSPALASVAIWGSSLTWKFWAVRLPRTGRLHLWPEQGLTAEQWTPEWGLLFWGTNFPVESLGFLKFIPCLKESPFSPALPRAHASCLCFRSTLAEWRRGLLCAASYKQPLQAARETGLQFFRGPHNISSLEFFNLSPL